MLFHAFYNRAGSGDVVLARVKKGTTNNYKKDGDLVILFNASNEIIGYNILQASNHFTNLSDGMLVITDEFMKNFNKILESKSLENIDYVNQDTFMVGKVVEIEEHPDSDHMHICKVDVGTSTLQIVCGASNVSNNKLVVVATIGTIMPSGLVIEPSKLRGVASDGMLCSSRELNLPIVHAPGILILDEKKYKIGEAFNIGGEYV